MKDDFDQEINDSTKDKYLIFNLGNDYFAISISNVIEITAFQKITQVPDSKDFIKGVINLRGKILSVIDARVKFGFKFKDYTDRTCIIICKHNDIKVGVIVDSVSEVSVISQENIEPPPTTNKMNKGRFLSGMGNSNGNIKMIVNIDSLLELESFKNISDELDLEV